MLLLCAALAAGKLWTDQSFRTNQTNWEKSRIANRNLVLQATAILLKHIDQPFDTVLPKLEGYRVTATRNYSRGRQLLDLENPQTRCHCKVQCINGKLVSVFGAGVAPPPPPKFWMPMELTRQYIAGYGLLMWLVLFPMCWLSRSYRQVLAEMTLLLVLLCITAWLVQPSDITWPNNELSKLQGIERSGQWYLLIPPGIISFFSILAIALSRPKPTEPLCPQCGYNLTANVSGICPECGSKISKRLRYKILHPPSPPPLPPLDKIEDDTDLSRGEEDESTNNNSEEPVQEQ